MHKNIIESKEHIVNGNRSVNFYVLGELVFTIRDNSDIDYTKKIRAIRHDDYIEITILADSFEYDNIIFKRYILSKDRIEDKITLFLEVNIDKTILLGFKYKNLEHNIGQFIDITFASEQLKLFLNSLEYFEDEGFEFIKYKRFGTPEFTNYVVIELSGTLIPSFYKERHVLLERENHIGIMVRYFKYETIIYYIYKKKIVRSCSINKSLLETYISKLVGHTKLDTRPKGKALQYLTCDLDFEEFIINQI